MSSLVVGGVPIKVAVSSPTWSRTDGVDRARMFDQSLKVSQAGGAAREWSFSTPPVSLADAATYAAVLSNPAGQLCSGDILELPTMCSAEFLGGTPVSLGSTHDVVLSFKLHEVQSARVLLRYAPGDTVTGESFTRAAPPATYRNSGGAVSEAATDVKRDAHYDINDLVANSPSLLLEGADTNIGIWVRNLTNAAWAKTNMTATQDQAGADGGANSATRLTATAANATVSNQETVASSSRQMSAYVRRITGTGVIQMTTDAAGADWVTITITAGWTRFSITPKTLANPNFGFRIVTSGDEIAVDYIQNETGAPPSSVIPTTTVAVTRAVDIYSLPFTTPPGEITVYVKFIELGSLPAAGRVFSIASAADANPRFVLGSAVSFYQVAHITAAASVTSALAVVPANGDTVELMARLFGDGSVDVTQSINGGAATSGAQSAANALATAWSDDLLWLNSAGTAGSRGFAAYKSLKIVAGSRSLAEMRAL